MVVRNEVLDTGEALRRHSAISLKRRFERNVDTENMVNWDLVWKGYHAIANINNLRSK